MGNARLHTGLKILDAKNTTTTNKTRVSSGFVCSCLQQVFHGWKENKRAGCIPLKVKIISGLKSSWCSCLWIFQRLFQSDFHNQFTVLPSGPPHLSDPSMVAYRQGYLGNQRELHAHILITRNWVVSYCDFPTYTLLPHSSIYTLKTMPPLFSLFSSRQTGRRTSEDPTQYLNDNQEKIVSKQSCGDCSDNILSH